MLGLKNMIEIKRQLTEKKEIIKKSILDIQKVLGYLYQLNTQKINNKLIFIKKGVDKVNLAQKHLSSLTLSFEIENKDFSDVTDALKDAMKNVSKLEKLLESKGSELRRAGSSSQNTYNFRRDMDALHLAYNCLKNLDTDMSLEEKDLEKNELNEVLR